MKYNICINQKAIIDNGFDLDIIDCAVLDYIKDFSKSKKLKKIIVDGVEFFRIYYKHFIKEMPMLKITNKQALRRRIDKIVSCGILEKTILHGNSTYFRFGDRYDLLISSTTDEDWNEDYNDGYGEGDGDSIALPGGRYDDTRGVGMKSLSINNNTNNNNTKDNYTNNNYTNNNNILSVFDTNNNKTQLEDTNTHQIADVYVNDNFATVDSNNDVSENVYVAVDVSADDDCYVSATPPLPNVATGHLDENIHNIDNGKLTNEQFELFRKIFPHSRPSVKKNAKKSFLDCTYSREEIELNTNILAMLIASGVQDAQYVKACERWIRDFVPYQAAMLSGNAKKMYTNIIDNKTISQEKRVQYVDIMKLLFGKEAVSFLRGEREKAIKKADEENQRKGYFTG